MRTRWNQRMLWAFCILLMVVMTSGCANLRDPLQGGGEATTSMERSALQSLVDAEGNVIGTEVVGKDGYFINSDDLKDSFTMEFGEKYRAPELAVIEAQKEFFKSRGASAGPLQEGEGAILAAQLQFARDAANFEMLSERTMHFTRATDPLSLAEVAKARSGGNVELSKEILKTVETITTAGTSDMIDAAAEFFGGLNDNKPPQVDEVETEVPVDDAEGDD